MGTESIKKLEFKNSEIFKHQSDFTGDKKRVYTSFKMKKTTAFRGLCLCEYLKGEKTPPPEDLPPPGGKVIWDQVWDEKNQRPYYVNRETKETSWTVGAGDSVNVKKPAKPVKPISVKLNTRKSSTGSNIDIEYPAGSGTWTTVNKRVFNIASKKTMASDASIESSRMKIAEMLNITLEELIKIL